MLYFIETEKFKNIKTNFVFTVFSLSLFKLYEFNICEIKELELYSILAIV